MRLRIVPSAWTRLLAATAITMVLCLAAGCGGGGGTPESRVTSLRLSYYWETASGLLPITATVGDQVQLLAYGQMSGGGQLALTKRATWSSSNASVATVDAEGVLRATGVGATQIRASFETFTSSPLAVTVNARGATPTAAYYPFNRGNQWVYTGTEVGPAQVTPPVTLTITTQQQVVLEGKVWWELQVDYTSPLTPPGFLYLRHDDRGLQEVYYLRVGSTDVPRYVYRLQEPLTAGARWTDPVRSEHTWEIVSTAASVTVPAGTYANCFRVRERDVADPVPPATEPIPFTVGTWFAPGVGIVYTRTVAPTDPDGDSEQKLIRAQLVP